MVNFCHIVPTKHLSTFVGEYKHHLLLAHLIEEDDHYCKWYRDLKLDPRNHSSRPMYILDNSAFEMYKQGRPMYSSAKLLAMADAVKADYIAMSDYPGEHSSKTVQAAVELAPQFKAKGYGTFFVPQSEIGDVEDYISAFAWAASSPLVDYIGVSILGVPNAYGVERGNKLQRFFARWKMMTELKSRGILDMAGRNRKKIHFLGMVDGPNEISLCSPQFHIDTWDSSAAVWAGLNDISFDNSPTGLLDGKFEKEVDFNFFTDNLQLIAKASDNQLYIDHLCRDPYNEKECPERDY